MAKYSTGGSGGGTGESCELCGAANVDLAVVDVAGARLEVCDSCAEHGDRQETTKSEPDRSDENRNKRAAKNTAKMHDAAKGDASHWEDGADYDEDQLPYLVDSYGDRLTDARRDAGYQLEELANELNLKEADVLAVEQGRAAQAGLGGSVIGKLEEFLDVELAESQ